MRKTHVATGLFGVGLLVACGSPSSNDGAQPGATADGSVLDDAGGGASDAGREDGGGSASDASTVDANKAAACASAFGNELVPAFGRLDGTVLAVLPPASNQCALPNSDHVVLQVTMHGAAYRMVVNVHSDLAGDPRVQMAEVDAPLAGGAWAEGWHTTAAVDYPTTLSVHSTGFTPYDMAPLAQRIADFIPLGDKISVFATAATAYKDSAHLVHRNGSNHDGAIVVGASTATPKWLVFHFDGQVF